jgi:serine/threonine protein kinase
MPSFPTSCHPELPRPGCNLLQSYTLPLLLHTSTRPMSDKSDIWSLGCLAYHMAALQPPFQGSNPLAVAKAVVEARYPPLPDPAQGPGYSEQLRALVRATLQPDPDRSVRWLGADMGGALQWHVALRQ